MTEWEVRDNIGFMTLNNPPQNYLKEPEFVLLADLQKWTATENLRGIIITGKGRHFCAGADRDNIFKFQNEAAIQDTLRRGKAVLDHLSALPIPTIAAINGVCLGGGLEVALSCHIRISSDKALFSFPEASLHVMPGLHGTVALPQHVGLAKSIEMILTGKMVSPEDALKYKLVDYVVPAKELLDFSKDFLQKLTGDRSLPVIHAVMQCFQNSRRLPLEEATETGIALFCNLAVQAAKKNQESDRH